MLMPMLQISFNANDYALLRQLMLPKSDVCKYRKQATVTEKRDEIYTDGIVRKKQKIDHIKITWEILSRRQCQFTIIIFFN